MAHAALLHCSQFSTSPPACRRGSHYYRAPSHVPCRSRSGPRRRGGVVSLRPMASSTAAQAPAPAPPGLKEGIAGLYDESSGLWENIWGDHMHHGFYDSGEAASMDDHRRAQIRMIEEALAFAAVPSPVHFWRTKQAACSLVDFWADLNWLVLVYCERKTLLADWFELAENKVKVSS